MLRFAASLVASALLLGAAHHAGWLEPLHRRITEIRFEALTRPPTGSVVLVEIDAKSISALGEWPWKRRVHADLVRSLARLGAAEIAFDVDFSARSDEAEDAALEEALRETGGSAVLAAFAQRLTGDPGDARLVANRPLPRLRDVAWEASVNVVPDPDGRVRRYPRQAVLEGETVPSLGALLGGAAAGTEDFGIDFGIAAGALPRLSAIDVLEGRADPAAVAGRKVLVGATAIELRDFFQVPAQGIIPGALVQALAAETLLQNRALEPGPASAAPAGLLGFALLMAAASTRFRWRGLLAAAAGLALAGEAAAFAVQAARPIVLDTAPWHAFALAAGALCVLREIGIGRILLAIAAVERGNSEALLDRVITDNLDGIVVVGEDGLVRSFSRAAAATFAPNASDDWTGRPAAALLPPALAEALRQALDAPQETSPSPREITVAVGPAQRTLEYVVTPSRLAGGLRLDGRPRPDRLVACLTFRDITERRLAEKRLAYLARFDTLTGLPNRNHFVERLGALAERPSGAAVLYLDLDRFKTINDTLGHHVGDGLLHAAARRGFELVPPPSVLARLGGDEFAIIHEGSASDEALAALAERIIERLSEPYEVGGHRLAVGVSIGIARLEPGARDITTVMKNADTALYQAKRAGGGGLRFFDTSMDVALKARQQLEIALKDAAAREEFEVAYQPQFELATGRLVGVEALLRWNHPERGPISPAEFVPVAEEIGLMETLGEWVLRRACAEVASWPAPVRLAVNVSPSQFTRGDLVGTVSSALARSGLPADQLDIEITESLFLQESPAVKATMDALSRRGIGFALDDFGTGYSSLSYIRTFPISKIKIDRSFVTGLPHDREAIAIVQAVVALATNLGLRTNAEGLESEEQIALLRVLGCNEGQGYGLGRPQAGAAVAALLRGADTERLSA